MSDEIKERHLHESLERDGSRTMILDIIKYEHYGKEVFVKTALKGKHKEHCLCWECGEFYPAAEDMDKNCPIARVLFSLCVMLNIVTPVWECPKWTPPRTTRAMKKKE